MKRTTAAALLPLSLLMLLAGPAPAAFGAHPGHGDQAQDANYVFTGLTERFLGSAMRFSPVEATALGEHKYDAQLPDITLAGRTARRSEWAALLAALSWINPAELNRDNQVDYALLKNELQYRVWAPDVLQEWAWNPQLYNDAAAGSLYSLAARDFAPWDVRLKAATARMEALPAFLRESRGQLDPARVPLIFAQTVARQNAGILEIAETMLAPQAGALHGADRARFDAALAGLKAVVADQQTWLETVLVPGAKGDFRLGPARYDQKMKFALMSDLTRPQLKARALKAKADTRAEMYRLARRVLAGRAGAPPLPLRPSAAQQQAGIEAALALSYAKRPAQHLQIDAPLLRGALDAAGNGLPQVKCA